MTKTSDIFTKEQFSILENAIITVWNSEFSTIKTSDNMFAIACCIDSERLKMIDEFDTVQDIIFNSYYDSKSYMKMLKFLSDNIKLV